jgi:hypothetical protein
MKAARRLKCILLAVRIRERAKELCAQPLFVLLAHDAMHIWLLLYILQHYGGFFILALAEYYLAVLRSHGKLSKTILASE